MDGYLLEWANFLLRWLHVIAAISWIGESIYFVMLDNSLHKPKDPASIKRGVFGEMFAVHGGGFYHNQKYLTNPPFELNEDLHWSYWKSYTTWLSGFTLFSLIYLKDADGLLKNASSPWAWAAGLSGFEAGLVAVGFLIGGWIVYDQLCRRISPSMDRDGVLGIFVAVFVIVVAYLASHIFQGRAAFLLTGAVMATSMSANVFFWIIPGQRRMVNDIKAGRTPNPLDGKRGKQRSVHNTYFTLPVVFLMLSGHYSFTLNENGWIMMALIIVAGALIRQFFVLMHSGKTLYWLPGAGVAFLVAAFLVGAPKEAPASAATTAVPTEANAAAPAAPSASAASAPAAAEKATPASAHAVAFGQIKSIVQQRCVACHAGAGAPMGLNWQDDAVVKSHAANIANAVETKRMPKSNATGMTDDERALVVQWAKAESK